MKKSQVLINKPVFLGLSILDVSNTVMYEFWYDYLKPNMVKIQIFVTSTQRASL